MRAAAARPAGSPPLVVAGGGLADRVFAKSGDAPLPGVRLLGRVSDGELRALYTHATAFVFPSLTEGFGLPPLEAMLCGCPTVVSRAGAIPEVCGDASRYVDPTDEAGWTRAMVEVAGQGEDARRAAVEAGRRRAAPFTWARAARQMVDHLTAAPPSSRVAA
jgi:glycosyltransferase involved in cell wall biosynthesis